jgi:uncharacterized damage-inducible protein DinB
MTEIERAKRLLEYDAWADLETVRSFASIAATVLEQAQQDSPRPIQKLIAHIIGAKWTWLARTLGEQPPMAIWPDVPAQDLDRALADVQAAWRTYLDSQSENELSRVVTYANSRGEEYSNTVSDIVTQVVVHSEHHRGQIAQTVRALGGQPALTDYIQYARTAGA